MMNRIIVLLLLSLLIAFPTCLVPVDAATVCSVNYYYTSTDNPEGVPDPTSGMFSGDKWKITPAEVSQMVYTKTVGAKTETYTFKGWYTNINCLGKKYTPGAETTELKPSVVNGTYTLNLYGKWKCSETGGEEGKQEGETIEEENAESVAGISSISAYTFPEVGSSRPLGAKSTSGSVLSYSSSNPAVVSVDENGLMKANGAGSAEITITCGGDAGADPISKTLAVSVPSFSSRETALVPWKHLLIDTFFHINDRKYSFSRPGKYWKDSNGNWSGKTGGNGNTQSCITLPTVSLKRTGIISADSGNIWLSSNMSSRPNGTVKSLQKTSKKLKITFPHKSLKSLVKSGGVRYGDIVCRSGHTFVFMGTDSKGNPLIFNGGTLRNIGNGTKVIWGHNDRLTSKVKKQIRDSNAQGDKWRKGILSDSSFNGINTSGKNLNNAIHIVCSINTFTVKTSCVNGTISLGNNYMAGQDVVVTYAPSAGRTLDYVLVDGNKVDSSQYGSSYTFKGIEANHSVDVVYR